MIEEFKKAVNKPKGRKSLRIDDIPAELIKNAEIEYTWNFTNLFVKYETGELPKDFMESLIAQIPKKANTHLCNHCRTLSLERYVSKKVLRILVGE